MRVEANKADIAVVHAMLSDIQKSVPTVLSRAINAAMKNTQTRAVKLIGQEQNVKAKIIKSNFTIWFANKNDYSANLTCKSRPPGLINFGATWSQKKGGVSYKIKRKGAKQFWKHAWIQALRIGKGSNETSVNQVCSRDYSGPRTVYKPNRPYAKLPKAFKKFRVLYGPKIASTYSKPSILGPVQEFGAERMQFNLGNEAQKELNRHK